MRLHSRQHRRAALWLAALWLAALLAGARPARAQESPLPTTTPPPLTLRQYRDLLHDGAARLTAARGVQAEAEAVLNELNQISGVLLPNGDVVVVDWPESDDVRANVARAWAVRDRMRTVAEQIDLSAGDNTAARLAALAPILARPEYTYRLTLWERFLRWWDRLLRSFKGQTPELDSGSGAADATGWAAAILGGAALAAGLGWALDRLLRTWMADAAMRSRENGGDTPLTAAEARRQAQSQAQSGSFRAAVRSLYLSALLGLEEKGWAPRDRTRTNRELLQQLAGRAPVEEHLRPVVETFDEVWYGIHEPDRSTFDAYAAEIDALAALAAPPAEEEKR